MKKTKLLSLLLCLSLVCTLFVSGTTAYAEGESNPGDGMKINKTADVIDDKGTTRITLEAFATGSKVITTETKDVPTDIILVIDQSGSMGDKMGTVSYSQYTKSSETKNNFYYGKRHNGGEGNLWHKLDDDSYVSVSVTKTTTYNPLRTDLPNYNSYSECYWDYANNLYEKVGNEYKKVKLDSEYMYFVGNRYTYTFADGTTVVSDGDSTVPNLGSHAPLYTPAADNNSTVYTYTYTDNTGAVQTIGTSTGANATGPATFYKSTINPKQGEVRLTAIKNAATTFANAVAKKAGGKDGNINTTADNVNHRIAVVGFASQSGYGNNTELLSIKGSNSGSVGVAYNSITDQNLKDVLQSMDTQAGQKMVTDAINALAANGATRTDLGMNMANRILEKNPLVNNETRNRVVVVFTDGSPTNNNGFEKTVAQNAITTANAIKDGNTTVYTIGIFGGADAASAGAEPSEDLSDGASYMSAACNWFMQNVSSNNGTPRTPSFYLSAGDSASLNNIFQQISSNIQTGGSGTTLGSATVVKDIISPYFTLPDGASTGSIRLDTYACTGKNGDTYTWSSNSSGADGAIAAVDGNKVSVTGFNFSENWCGTETDANGHTTVRGKKLVISFDVKPKDGFLGGNGVPTNTSAGIYENATADKPVKEFPIPTVNVPIQPVTVSAEDKNVYLLGNVTENDCKTGASATCGTVGLNLNAANYGLASWQTKFVEITTTVTDKDRNAIPTIGLKDLTADGTYTISVKVKPNPQEPGIVPPTGTPATEKTGTATQNINVFKPELTFKDTEAYYGAAVPENLESNLKSTVWKHGETVADPATMIGEKPNLTITCTPDGNKILNNTINTTEDIGVAVTVKIGDTDVTTHTTFQHTNCANKTCTVPNDYQFLIHVKTCTLTVKKELAAGTAIDDGQSFIFQITGPGIATTRVVIQGGGSVTLKGLKVGTYTVKEDTTWSWRYETTNGTQTATLSADRDSDEVTVTNTLKNDKWVTTDVYCKNEFKNGGIKTIINGNGKTVNGVPATN